MNGRIFVNNVSLGVYAKVVQSAEYRDAKRQTTLAMLGDLVGPGAEPFDLRFVGPDGAEHDGARIIQVSNNPYRLTSLAGFGSRARLDTGELGVAAADLRGAKDIAGFFASQWLRRLDRFQGWIRWNTEQLTIESGAPVEAGVDGEALLLDPPLVFRSLPGVLRVRVSTSALGYSPAALRSPSLWWTVAALWRAAQGAARPPSTKSSAARRRVTYCLALRLDEGLVFLSDTRTNAGVDDVGTYRKLHVLRPGDDRVFVLQSAGSLATTQEVLDSIEADLGRPGEHESLATVSHLHEAAVYLGRLNREVSQRHSPALGASATATFILGGQIAGERPDLLLVYPEGNYIRVSDDRPFLQIGESKYGKFMLELAVHARVDTATAIKIAVELDDQHGPRQPLGRAALRPRRLPQRLPRGRQHAGRSRLPLPRLAQGGVAGALPRRDPQPAAAPDTLSRSGDQTGRSNHSVERAGTRSPGSTTPVRLSGSAPERRTRALRRLGSADGLQGLGRLRERELLAGEAPHEPAAGDEPTILHAAQRPLEVSPAHGRVLGGDEVVEHDAPPLEELVGQRLGQLLPIDVGRRGGHEGPPPGGLGGTQAAGRPQPRPSGRGGRRVAATGGDGPHRLEAVGDQQAARHALPQRRLDVGQHPAGGPRQLAGEARALRGEHLDHLGHRPAGRHGWATPRLGGRRAATAGRRGARATPGWCGWRRRGADRGRPATGA